MRKLASTLLLCLAISGPAAAQSAVARFQFEDAEKAFADGDYATTLAKLDEAEKSLGFGNPTILHLRILAQQELLSTGDYRFADLERQRGHCATYLREYGELENVIEKTREVYRICETLKGYPNDALSVANANFAASRYQLALMDILALEKEAKTWSEPLVYLKIRAAEHWVEDEAYWHAPRARVLAQEVRKYLAEVAAGKARPSPASLEYIKSIDARLAGLEDLISGMQARGQASFDLLQKAAAAGTRVAHYRIGQRFEGGSDGFHKNPALAVEWYRRGAAAGDAMSMASLGSCYDYEPCGLTRNPAEARAWYEKAVAVGKGNKNALADLAYLYYKADGVEQDLVKARRLFEIAAEKGSGFAMQYVQIMYWRGEGGPADDPKSVYWLRRAVKADQEAAMTDLGYRHWKGEGVAKDYALARKWMEAAAAKGQPDAMNWLATWYAEGEAGYPRDPNQAQQWRAREAKAREK